MAAQPAATCPGRGWIGYTVSICQAGSTHPHYPVCSHSFEIRVNLLDYQDLAAETLRRCDALARCSDEPGRITRLFCSPAMQDAHRLVSEWMYAAGMAPHVDPAANLVSQYLPPGCDPRRRIVIGSHLDSVVNAGRYDGVLGVLMGIAVVERVRTAGTPLSWAIEVIGFSDEEGVRFGMPFLGSRALVGTLDDALLQLVDASGKSMADALIDFGVDPLEIADYALTPAEVVAYLEPHIEQGPRLEAAGQPIGIVSSIAGQTRLAFEWTGPGGHAGTVPVWRRSDPLVAACRWIIEVERMGHGNEALYTTVGRLEVQPNVTNCIPQRVTASLDVRHADDRDREAAVRKLTQRAEQLADEAKLEVAVRKNHEHGATPLDQALAHQLAAAAEAAGHPAPPMISGAGHDAGVLAPHVPAAMLFLRSPGGVSHDPAEAVDQADVAVALEVMVRFLENLSLQSPSLKG